MMVSDKALAAVVVAVVVAAVAAGVAAGVVVAAAVAGLADVDGAEEEGAGAVSDEDVKATGGARGLTVTVTDLREKDDDRNVCANISFSLSMSSGL